MFIFAGTHTCMSKYTGLSVAFAALHVLYIVHACEDIFVHCKTSMSESWTIMQVVKKHIQYYLHVETHFKAHIN